MICVAALVCAAVAAAPRFRDGSGPLLAAVALVLATGSGFVAYRDHALQGRLGAAASAVAGVDVAVRCPEPFFGEFLWTPGVGHVVVDADGNLDGLARLDAEVCAALAGWPGNAEDPQARVAVHVLTHEAAHLRGDLVEASAECWAMQHSARVGEHLGAAADVTGEVAQWYVAEQWPRMGSAYRDPERCRADGEWDLTPGDGTFP